MKRVLLVAPFTKGDLFKHRWVTPHLGIWRIASYLSRYGNFVKVYDCNDPTNIESFDEVLKYASWDIIGFSDLQATMEYTIPNIFLARERLPKAVLIAGGSAPALEYQFYLDKTPIDIVVLAEGEYPLKELCEEKRWQDIAGIVFKNDAKVLNGMDYWDISKNINFEKMQIDKFWKKTANNYDNPNYNEINTVRLFTSNYCPMGCAFCTLTLWRKNASGKICPVVYLSVDNIIEQIMDVLKEYPDTKQIFFVDDDFFLSKDRGKIFCQKVIQAKKKNVIPSYLSFICLTNINRIDKENIVEIAEAGFRVLSIGVESVSQNVLDSLDKKQTVEKIWEVTDLILKNGIRPYYTLLMWTPYGRLEDVMIDLIGFRKLGEMGAGLSVEPYLIPLPGTKLWEDYTPMSMRWVDFGNGVKFKKGFAWLPKDKKTLEVFREFEKFYPKYRKYRFDKDGVGHKEKNYQAGVLLDCVEIVLKVVVDRRFDFVEEKFSYDEAREIYKEVNKIEPLDVDIVGDFVYV